MNGEFSPASVETNKFKLGKKWFWIGIAVAFFNVVGGLIYGVTLALEKEHRNEGLIIIGFSIVWGIIKTFVIMPWYFQSDLFLKIQPAFR